MRLTTIMAPATACLLLATASCKKEDNSVGTNSVINYTQYKPGNYWIYQNYTVDDAGNGQPGDMNGVIYYHSVYVEKDTLIANHTYHKLMKPYEIGSRGYQPLYLRDSANYEVDNFGYVTLAPDDFATTFRTFKYAEPQYISDDSAIIMHMHMADRNKTITVPAGTFQTISMDMDWSFYPFAASGTNIRVRTQHQRYAPGIGIVTETLPFYTPIATYDERRLVRYHLN